MTRKTQTNEKPIIFSTEMVQAILDRDKTMTRRTTGLDYINKYPDYWHLERCGMVEGLDGFRSVWSIGNGEGAEQEFVKSPYGKPGDLLYIRETWKPYSWSEDGDDWTIQYKSGGKAEVENLFDDRDKEEKFWIKLSDELSDSGCPIDDSTGMFVDPHKCLNWRPSIFMPKKASRILLEVTDDRVERVQDISVEDIKAEGVQIPVSQSGSPLIRLTGKYAPSKYLPKGALSDENRDKVTEGDIFKIQWASRWDFINADKGYGWDGNPWVWVVSFKLKEVKG